MSPSDRESIIEGKGDFPRVIVSAVLSSDIEEQRKVHDILAIAGTWIIATTGAR
ncbi:hypothetical protein [Corynebacterium stationis]|uniref:hypothetical protein n=1 Tax=Corynebacterium stationis TaxID=1705 RepID=UPI000B07D898|nr:hypothetical protein [Corynebacterium stationis]HJG65635.1 hypothetical protein [Corynebacterium stationis]